jgi:hypothetical protein
MCSVTIARDTVIVSKTTIASASSRNTKKGAFEIEMFIDVIADVTYNAPKAATILYTYFISITLPFNYFQEELS